MVPGISINVYSADKNLRPSEIIYFSKCEDRESNILCFPKNYRTQTPSLFQGTEDLPSDSAELCLARQALRPFYQDVVDELWSEILSALEALGFAHNRAADLPQSNSIVL